jgi:hypothetical protein
MGKRCTPPRLTIGPSILKPKDALHHIESKRWMLVKLIHDESSNTKLEGHGHAW